MSSSSVPPGRPPSAADDDMTAAGHAAALAALPGIGPATLAAILSELSPVEAWEEVRAGRIERPPPRSARSRGGPTPAPGRSPAQASLFGAAPGGPRQAAGPAPRGAAAAGGALAGGAVAGGMMAGGMRAAQGRSWAEAARRVDPVSWWEPFRSSGVHVTWLRGPAYPEALAADPEPPGVLFWSGDIATLSRLCVAVVGTRHATPDGRGTAYHLGRDLAAAGVCVVSGLALGIDGAAHAGAVAAVRDGAPGATVGVAASGVDVPYPRQHWSLWREVRAAGALLSENVPGRPAQAWRFPSRNRVIAGLCRMVVVVESHMTGGSLITAEAAIERGIEVRVVPGPVHSPASAGSNQLLYDGPGPVRDARDVLDALGILRPDPRADGAARPDRGEPERPAPDRDGRQVLEAIGWRPASTGQVMTRTGLDAAGAQQALEGLVAAGWVAEEGGWWVRRGP